MQNRAKMAIVFVCLLLSSGATGQQPDPPGGLDLGSDPVRQGPAPPSAVGVSDESPRLVYVTFYNPGFYPQSMYLVQPDGSKKLMGAIPGETRTPRIKARPGWTFEFVLANYGDDSGRYVVTGEPEQSFTTKGYLESVDAPERSWLEEAWGSLLRNVSDTFAMEIGEPRPMSRPAWSKETVRSEAEYHFKFDCPGAARRATLSERRLDGCSNPVEKALDVELYNRVFRAACDRHDVCYASPWQQAGFHDIKGRAACDSAFVLDMRHICTTSSFNAGLLGEVECLGAAEVYFDAVRAAAARAYVEGQKFANRREGKEAGNCTIIP